MTGIGDLQRCIIVFALVIAAQSGADASAADASGADASAADAARVLRCASDALGAGELSTLVTVGEVLADAPADISVPDAVRTTTRAACASRLRSASAS